MFRRRSSAVPLAWLYAALIVYASLYPFTDWRAASGGVLDFLVQDWPHWWSGFDVAFNLLGYLPLGLLICVAGLRLGLSRRFASLAAVTLAALLSFSLELAQNHLPARVPSNLDLALNTAGAAVGMVFGLAVHSLGGVARWQSVRERWIVGRGGGGPVLLLVWPVGLLFPAPVVFGLGQFLPRLRQGAADAVGGGAFTPAWLDGWLAAEPRLEPLLPAGEVTIVALGLLVPCLLGFSFVRPGWRRLALVMLVGVVGFTTTTLSTTLNFGPQHALAWVTRLSLWGMSAGALLALLCARLPSRASAALCLVAATVLVMLMAHAPTDPYFAQSLQSWEQGRFIRFHGAAKWVGWWWPVVVIGYLLKRLSARDAH